MKLIRRPGSLNEIWHLFIQNSSVTDGSGLTGLSNTSPGLICYYHRDTDTTPTQVTLNNMTLGTYTSGGFKVISDSFMAGWYQFCPPNAALASGAKSVSFSFSGASNMAPVAIEVDLGATQAIVDEILNTTLDCVNYAIGTVGYTLCSLTPTDIADAVWSTNLPGPYVLPQAGARMLQAYNALVVDTNGELAAPPTANDTLRDKIVWLSMLARNKITQTAAVQTVYADNGATVVAAASVSDDGTLFTRGKFQ